MILQQHAIARIELARGAPLGHQAETRQRGDAAHAVIGREAQRMPFGRRQGHQRLHARAEETLRRAGVIDAVDARRERFTNQFGHLPRALLGLHPGVCGYAGVGGANVFAPPVVVHLVDAVDEDEARLSEVVGGRHDDVPHAARRQRLVDLAADETVFARDVALGGRPLAPQEFRRVVEFVFGRVVLLGE